MPINFSNKYHDLGSHFSVKSLPSPVAEPEVLLWNTPLAQSLGINLTLSKDENLIAEYFSGNTIFEGSQPIAQAYSGHQFGYFNPQLGDGRAHLLGDVLDENGQSWDIQLKGSGTSQFSRGGDGRCAMGPALREYIMSEAMFALGVPTTRCLSVVATGQAVYRDRPLPGAVVTRVAESHIRVGTFQFYAVRKDISALKILTRYAIERHFPEISLSPTSNSPKLRETGSEEQNLTSQNVVDFFEAVLNRQVKTIVSWLRVGFIHGVMNTDNAAISGETIDYGPCAMLNHYDAKKVFSSIDSNGRYAFGKQSEIMQWNMARLADCLLSLIDEDEDIALAKIEPLLKQFANDLLYQYYAMMLNKLGIGELLEGDVELVNDLLTIMQEKRIDYTQFFVDLAENINQEEIEEVLSDTSSASVQKSTGNDPLSNELANEAWQQWLVRWYARIANDASAAKNLMKNTNPLVIPRNHHVEAVLASTQETGDLAPLRQFLTVLRQPYTKTEKTHMYQDVPHDGDKNYHTFCGT